MKIFALILIAATTVTNVMAQDSSKKARVEAETVLVTSGFGTGNSYRELSSAEQAAYASGVIDGLLCASFFGGTQKKMAWLHTFVTGKTNIQVAAILTKYLNEHPEEWDQPLNMLAHQAFRMAAQKTQHRSKD